MTFTDAINATHTEGVYQGGNIAPLQTVSVPAASNGGFTYTITGSDLLNGILLNPENNDSVTASCTLTSLLATSTALTTSSNPINRGLSVQFAVTVSGNGGTPTGSVALYDGGSLLGTGTLAGGATTFAPIVLSEGFHNITATYLGNATFTSSMSPALTQAVEILLGDGRSVGKAVNFTKIARKKISITKHLRDIAGSAPGHHARFPGSGAEAGDRGNALTAFRFGSALPADPAQRADSVLAEEFRPAPRPPWH